MSESPERLPLIYHEIEDEPIEQRAVDGYINATAMCKAAGKQFGHYNNLQSTKEFLKALSLDIGIPISSLIQTFIGTPARLQGTWVHPQIATHLAQWCSPTFAVLVSRWVIEWIRGYATRRARLPDHIRRYLVNRQKIPSTHFSMLDQMVLRLLAPLEEHGYILPRNLMPDIALGRMFSQWLREKGYDPDTFPTYKHRFLDQRPIVDARLYPNDLITEFNDRLEWWLRNNARRYFAPKDRNAMGPLEKVLLALPPADV